MRHMGYDTLAEEDDFILGPYERDAAAYKAYAACIRKVMQLEQDGKLRLLQYSDGDVPYTVHTIHFEWLPTDDTVIVSAEDMREMLDGANGNILYDDHLWTISMTIYRAV